MGPGDNSNRVLTVPADPKKFYIKVSLYTVLVLAGASMVVYTATSNWLHSQFWTRAEAEEHRTKEIHPGTSKELEKIQLKLDSHVREFRLWTAVGVVEDLEQSLWHLEQVEKTEGPSQASAARKRDIEQRLSSARAYRDCIVKGRPDCEQLRQFR